MDMESETDLTPVAWADDHLPPDFGPASPDGDVDCDLLVIGGGLSGVSVALHGALRGLRVVLLEQGTIGCGASGRNAGFVVPLYPGIFSPKRVEQTLGRRKGEELNGLVAGSARFVYDQIGDLGIDCAAVQEGWMQPSHSSRSAERARQLLEDWQAVGADVRAMGRDEAAERMGSNAYGSGLFASSGGHLNPYLLTVGLAEAAAKAGATILQRSRADGFETCSRGYSVAAGGARVRARKLLLATNGYTGRQWGPLATTHMALRLSCAVTEPLSSNPRPQVLPHRPCVSDMRAVPRFHRMDEKGRLVIPGLAPPFGLRPVAACRDGERNLVDTFPQLGAAPVDRYWEGYCAFTPTNLPALIRLHDNAFALSGYSGRGVALSQALGPHLAAFFADSLSLEQVPLAVEAPVARPFNRVRAAAAPIVAKGLGLVDRLGFS